MNSVVIDCVVTCTGILFVGLVALGLLLCVLLCRFYKTQNQFLVRVQFTVREIQEELYNIQIQGDENFHRLKASIEDLQMKTCK